MLKSFFIICISILLCFNVFSHGTSKEHALEENIEIELHTYSVWEKVLPFSYIGDEKYFTAILVTLFWVALFYGIYTLFVLVAGRHINSSSTKK